MSDVLLSERRGGVAVLSLNRPDRHNAINDALAEALDAEVATAVSDPEVRVVLLRGEGPSFSSGRDTGALGKHGEIGRFAYLRRSQELNRRIFEAPKPVIAALKGYVLGKALEIALAADIRIAAADTRLGFPEVGFGLITDNGGAANATVLAGPSKAKYLIMSGEQVDAVTAEDWGLVDFVVPLVRLDERAFELAARIADRPPLAVAFAKDVVNLHSRAAVLNGGRAEMFAELALFASEDHDEARAARADKRRAEFKGR